jgi:crotonobetainyl-CoA:carnitine CoA-transferase CaiB-like acyl-CoA transferase
VLGADSLTDDPRYATLAERLTHTDELDHDLAALTGDHDAAELAQRLRAAGVPASKSATTVDIIGDGLLWDRELYRFVSDHREGQRPVLAATSASTTTMFVTRSWARTRWRNDDRHVGGDDAERAAR